MCTGSINETRAKYCKKNYSSKSARKLLEIAIYLKISKDQRLVLVKYPEDKYKMRKRSKGSITFKGWQVVLIASNPLPYQTFKATPIILLPYKYNI